MRGGSMDKFMKSVNAEQVVICVLLVVLVVLVAYYVKQNTENFEEKPTLYFFYVTWCPHCTKAAPKVSSFEENNSNVVVKKVDCDKEKALAKEHGVSAYPTVILVKANGEKVEYERGVSEEGLEKFVEENL